MNALRNHFNNINQNGNMSNEEEIEEIERELEETIIPEEHKHEEEMMDTTNEDEKMTDSGHGDDCEVNWKNIDTKYEHYYDLAVQILNKMYPEYLNECMLLTTDEYFTHIFRETKIDMDQVMYDFIKEIEVDLPCNAISTPYDILKDHILHYTEGFDN